MVIVRILKNTKYEPGVKLGVGWGFGEGRMQGVARSSIHF